MNPTYLVQQDKSFSIIARVVGAENLRVFIFRNSHQICGQKVKKHVKSPDLIRFCLSNFSNS